MSDKHMRDKKRESRIEKGFTLAEAILASVVLSIAAAGILLPYAAGARARAEGMHRTLAAKLASDMIERIVATPFGDVIATYNGYSEAQGQIRNAAGELFTDPAYDNFSRDVTCQYVYVPQQSGSVSANFILATVSIYYRSNQLVTFNRLIAQ